MRRRRGNRGKRTRTKHTRRRVASKRHSSRKQLNRSRRLTRRKMTKRSRRQLKRVHKGGQSRIEDITDTEESPPPGGTLPTPIEFSSVDKVNPLHEMVDLVFEKVNGDYHIPENKVAFVSAHGIGLDTFTVVPEGVTIMFPHGSGNPLYYQVDQTHSECVQLDYKGYSIYTSGSLIQDYTISIDPLYTVDEEKEVRMWTYRGVIDISLQTEGVDDTNPYKNELLAVELSNKITIQRGRGMILTFYTYTTPEGVEGFISAIQVELDRQTADHEIAIQKWIRRKRVWIKQKRVFQTKKPSGDKKRFLKNIHTKATEGKFQDPLLDKYRFGEGLVFATDYSHQSDTPEEVFTRFLSNNNQNVYTNEELQPDEGGDMKEVTLSELFHRLQSKMTEGVSVPQILIGGFCRSGDIVTIDSILRQCGLDAFSDIFSGRRDNETPELFRTGSLANNLVTRNFRDIIEFVSHCIGDEETQLERETPSVMRSVKELIRSMNARSNPLSLTTDSVCQLLRIYIHCKEEYSTALVRPIA